MSHSTVLVVLKNSAVEKHGDIDDALTEALEPFDENKYAPEYIKLTKADAIKKQREHYEAIRDRGNYAEYLKDPAAYRERAKHNPQHVRYISEEFPKILAQLDDEDFLYKQATEWEKLDSEGNILSSYNPKSFRLQRVSTNHEAKGLVLSGHDQGKEADQSAGNEVLFEVRDNEEAGGVSEGEPVTRRPLHLLLPVYQGAEQGTDPAAAPGLDDSQQVRDGAGGVRRPAAAAGGAVRYLSAATGREYQGDGNALAEGGPLPFDGSGAGPVVSQLQHGDRIASGLAVIANSRDELPATPAGWEWSHEVSGAKWDWYTVGGRWAGSVMNWTDTIHHPAEVRTPTCTTEAWDEKVGGADYLQKKDLNEFSGTFAFLDAEGEWHERGRMGWFGMVSDEAPTDEWDARLKQLVEDVDDEDWLVVVDVHI